jgi:hypothetical protein
MTLKEKFDKIEVNIEDGLSGIVYLNDIESEECEKIADEFAIGFAEWIEEHQGGTPNSKILKELLEIYKKEKGL